MVKRLKRELKLNVLELKYNTQIAGAVGAALFAKGLYEKAKR